MLDHGSPGPELGEGDGGGGNAGLGGAVVGGDGGGGAAIGLGSISVLLNAAEQTTTVSLLISKCMCAAQSKSSLSNSALKL